MTANNPNLDLVIINALLQFLKFYEFVLKILSGNENLALLEGHNSGANRRKKMCNHSKLDLVNVNADIKFGEYLSFCSQNIERQRNFGVNQGP